MATKKISDLTLRSDFDDTCLVPVDDPTQTWRVTGAQVAAYIRDTLYVAPTVQKFTSGSGTYTTPAGVKYIRVKMVGGGAGGGGSANSNSGGSPAAGTNGGDTTFGTSLLTAGGGVAGTNYRNGGVGGAVTVNSPAVSCASFAGGAGSAGVSSPTALDFLATGAGGGTPFTVVSAATSFPSGTTGFSPTANTGGGGSGASVGSPSSGATTGGGGGGGGFVDAIIGSPSATYAYAIGAAGTGGAAGTSGSVGGAGAAGIIIVEEYYQ